jgi:hypothetical protein
MAATHPTPHRWRFFRAGDFDQVRLDDGKDFENLDQLDQKLWVALCCPTAGLELEERTLNLVDTDKDGRIRAPEMIAAARWVVHLLKKPSDLTKRRDGLPLDDIDDATEEGRVLRNSAKNLLSDLGKPEATEITVADTVDTAQIFAATRFNGDGIVPAGSADDDETKQAITEIVAAVGGETDRCGALGVSRAKLDAFFEAAKAFDAWQTDAETRAAEVLPLGPATADAVAATDAVAAKIDDYFARQKIAAFDARAIDAVNGDAGAFAAIAGQLVSANGDELANLPIAHVEIGRALPLGEGVNPAWAARLSTFVDAALSPLLASRPPRAPMTEAEWRSVQAKLTPFREHAAKKAGVEVEALGISRVRALLAGESRAKIDALIAKDEALRPEAEAIASVEKLVRYYRDLHALLDNFVSFRDFYSKKRKAIFQAGTLYLDGRSCELCVRVADVGAHATFATAAKTFLAYCECSRKATGEKMFIAAAFTGGDSDALLVGRNGLFYDRKGNDWDATVVKIVEHPISIRQAFWLPYKRVAKLIGDQVEKFASARDKEMQDKTAANVEAAGKAADTAASNALSVPAPGAPGAPATPPPPPAPPPAPTPAAPPPPQAQAFDVAKFAGIFAAIGLALGTIGSALAAVATGFLGLRWWQMPIVIAGVMLLISGPSMLLAALKLRQRNLGPILDANGWAVNARARMNIPFGGSLTHVATLPPGAERSLDDPYAEKETPWRLYLFVVAVLGALWWAWKHGYLHH